MLLVMLLTSCKSVETVVVEKEVVPPLVFPPFPVLGDVVRENGRVSVSEEFLIELARYKIRIEETQRNYEDLCLIYGNEGEEFFEK